MIEAIDLVIVLLIVLCGLWLYKKSKNWTWIDKLASGISEPDVVEEYDNTLKLAEQQVQDAEKEEAQLKTKKEKIKSRISKK